MNKQLTDKNNKAIIKGSIVHYKDGHYRVTSVSVSNQTVNLSNIFGGVIFYKKVALSDIYEDETAWYDEWQKSESYQAM